MKKALIFLVLVFIAGVTPLAHAGSGRNPPKKLSERQIKVLEEFIPMFPTNIDPFEIVAIAMVESSLTPTAIGFGNYGILQINCTVHKRNLKKLFGFKNCRKDMLDMRKNLRASLYILNAFRTKYKRCRGQNAYACYNGGQGWKAVKKKCLRDCSGKACRSCNRPARYQNSVKKHIRFLKKKYAEFITRLYKPAAAVAR